MDHTIEGLTVRRAGLRDMTDLIAVERDAFGQSAWPADYMAEILGRPHHAAIVAEGDGDGVVGFLIYRREPGALNVLDVAVDRGYRRQGVGSFLLTSLAESHSDLIVGCFVPRAYLPVHGCLRSAGFHCCRVFRSSDDYLFVREPPGRDGGNARLRPRNRPQAPAQAKTQPVPAREATTI